MKALTASESRQLAKKLRDLSPIQKADFYFFTLVEEQDPFEFLEKLDLKKHGDHDQSSHGNWAHGMEVAPEVVASTLSRVRENGGLSVKMTDGSEPTKGYMVAKGKKYAAIVKADDFYDPEKGAKILGDYMKRNKADLATGKNYLGLWHNTEDGQVYLDVSENIMDEAEATSRGRERDQISIWDVSNFKEISTGGTGGIEKTRGGRTARHIEDDRRTNRRLRQTDLGEVGKAFRPVKVIYFDFGLKPVLKHGEHDQSEHGNWARGYTDEERTRMEAMKDRGPSVEDLDNVLSEPREIGRDELQLLVENDSDLYSLATEDIDARVEERLARLQAEFPNHEYSEQEKATIYEDTQRDMVDAFVDDNESELTDRVRIENGEYSENDPQELQPLFEEVYGVSHSGVGLDGQEHTLTSSIFEVDRNSNNIFVRGTVNTEDGEEVGEIGRRFFKQDGVWAVEHEIFAIMDDDYKGTGFGQEFIKQSEAWYTAKGFGFIEVGTAWDGARHWARAGYDFRPDKIEDNIAQIATAVAYNPSDFGADTPAGKQFDSLMTRTANGYRRDSEGRPTWDSIKDMKSDDFPIPADFANIGYTKGARDWAGKTMMDGLRMKYVKVLTPEGQNLLSGPVDLDGDGLVYDGTAREKPAPSRGNK